MTIIIRSGDGLDRHRSSCAIMKVPVVEECDNGLFLYLNQKESVMKYIAISELSKHIGQNVTLQGWVHTLRDQKHVQFLILRNRTGSVQVVHEKTGALAGQVSALTRESAIAISGRVVENPGVRLGGVEIQLAELRVVNVAESPLPLDPFSENASGIDHRLDWRHIDLRVPRNRLIFEIQTTVEGAMREYWMRNHFIEIHSPKFMGTASESGAELFALPYFNTTAYLAQSPQFYKQMAMASGFDRVFEIAPVFRADPSFTSRHTTEFTSVDVEIAWIDGHEDVMACEEAWLQYVIQVVREKHGDAVAENYGVEIMVPAVPFPRVTMAEALAVLSELGHTPEREGDLDPKGERLLGEYIRKTQGCDYVFVIDYPVSVRPFYHMRHAEHSELTRSFDLLCHGVEITTGAQREHRPDVLKAQAREKGLDLETIQFYLDFFKYGCPPHGGFGFGLSRLLMVMLGLSNVRETTFLSRTPNRLHP